MHSLQTMRTKIEKERCHCAMTSTLNQPETKSELDERKIVSQSDAPINPAFLKPEKDTWDKVAAIAPIISGVFIFLAGGVFTYTYNQQQLKVQEIQTIEKFIPHLTGSEQSKKAAILAINSLTDAKLAGRIAALYASQGTVSALQSISKNGTDKEREIAEQALAKTMTNLREREDRLDDLEDQHKRSMQEAETSAVAEVENPVALIGMAVSFKTTGQYLLAEQLLKRALALVEKKHGAETSEAASIWRKLAELNAARGNHAQSEACNKKALAIESKLAGKPAGASTTATPQSQPNSGSPYTPAPDTNTNEGAEPPQADSDLDPSSKS